jgi:hypothetical protein
MFPKNDNKVPKQDILGLVLCTYAEYKYLWHMLSMRIVLISVCSVCAQTILAIWRMLRTFEENLKICMLRYRGWDCDLKNLKFGHLLRIYFFFSFLSL